jgi:glutamate transport system permease protein
LLGSFFGVLADHWPTFRDGFRTTIELFLVSAAGALVLGILLGAARVGPVPALRSFGAAYVNVVRNTPLTLIFAFGVFAAPKLEIGLDYLPTACVALTAYTAAFVGEAVRAGVNTVPVGQAEAARALGLTFGQTLTAVVLPQAVRAIVPPLMSVLIALLKNTTIAAGFSVLEAGAIPAYLAEQGEPRSAVLIWITVGFLLLIGPLSLLQRYLERRWAVPR